MAENDAIAFSSAARVTIERALIPCSTSRTARRPAASATAGLSGWVAGTALAPGRRQSEELERRAHRVGGVLTAARAGTRAGVLLHRAKLVGVDPAGVVGADGFEDVLDGEVAVAQPPRLDGAAVEHEARDVHPAERHRGRRESSCRSRR